MLFFRTLCLLAYATVSLCLTTFCQAAQTNVLQKALSHDSITATANAKNDPPAVTARIVANRTAGTPQSDYKIGVELTHSPGWNTYWRNPGQSGQSIQIEWILPKHWSVTALGWPLPERHKTGNIVTFNYSGTVLLPYKLDIPWGTPYGTNATIRAKVSWLACNNICVPESTELKFTIPIRVASDPSKESPLFTSTQRNTPEIINDTEISAYLDSNQIRIDIPKDAGNINSQIDFYPFDNNILDLSAPARVEKTESKTSLFLTAHPDFLKNPALLSGVLVADNGITQKGWAIETRIPVSKARFLQSPIEKSPQKVVPAITISKDSLRPSVSSIGAIGFALLGGFLLNFMPCVFPVLSLKLLHLIDSSRRRGSLIAHGFSFTAGVLCCMALLSTLIFALKHLGLAIGWGFQLQNPVVVALLVILFFAISLNLLGVFEFTAATHLTDTRALREVPKDGPIGSFFTGILTVVVASPCTAPFMGAALGYALTQEIHEAFPVFIALGTGISIPWLILTIFPFWMKWLPRPGAWMLTLRKILSIPMLIAMLWLLWVYSHQVNLYGVITLVLASGLSAVYLWGYGREQYGRGSFCALRILTAAGTATCITLIGLNFFNEAKVQTTNGWRIWTQEAVERSLAESHPVIVDFTASWCITCQYNKQVALQTRATEKVLQRLGYHRYTADWTNKDESISRTLQLYKRPGVPLYLLYNTRGQVTILPEILTEAKLIEAIRKNAQKNPSK